MSFEWVTLSNHHILCRPILFLLLVFPSIRIFSSELALLIQTIGASALASVFLVNIQGWFPLELIGLILLQFKDYQESSTPQFESINSLTLSVLYGPTVSSMCDYWKNHSFDYTDLCWQSDVSAF